VGNKVSLKKIKENFFEKVAGYIGNFPIIKE